MKHSLQKMISSMLTLTTALALTGLGMVSSAAAAGQLKVASAELSDNQSGDNAIYTIRFNVSSTTAIKKVKFIFANLASAGTVEPSNMSTAAAVKDSVFTVDGTNDDSANWTLDNSTDGTLTYTATNAVTPAGGDTWMVVTSNIDNNTTTLENAHPLCDSVTDSESCWIRISTIDGAAAVIDQTAINYTVINPITVTATVDPILTFTVAGINGADIAGNDGNAGAGTVVDSTSTTIPFLNLTVGTPKVGQQKLTILTNAKNGYDVYHKFWDTAQGDIMTGTYTANNIDPFTYDNGGGAASFVAPGAWHAPTGNQNSVNSAWIGLRTTDADVANFASANVYSPPVHNSTAAIGANDVMTTNHPDNGTTSVYITYKLEANAYQASDQYSGTMVYNVIPKY